MLQSLYDLEEPSQNFPPKAGLQRTIEKYSVKTNLIQLIQFLVMLDTFSAGSFIICKLQVSFN